MNESFPAGGCTPEPQKAFTLPAISHLAVTNNFILLELLKRIEAAEPESAFREAWEEYLVFFKDAMPFMEIFHSLYQGSSLEQLVINLEISMTLLIRKKKIWEAIQKFLEKSKKPVVILFGSGFDTYFLKKSDYLKKNLAVEATDVTPKIFMFDYKAVNELKQDCLDKSSIKMPDFCQNEDGDIQESLSEFLSQNDISKNDVLVVAEGYTMYRTQEQLKETFELVSEHVSSEKKLEAVLDHLHPEVVTPLGAAKIDGKLNSTDCTKFIERMKNYNVKFSSAFTKEGIGFFAETLQGKKGKFEIKETKSLEELRKETTGKDESMSSFHDYQYVSILIRKEGGGG